MLYRIGVYKISYIGNYRNIFLFSVSGELCTTMIAYFIGESLEVAGKLPVDSQISSIFRVKQSTELYSLEFAYLSSKVKNSDTSPLERFLGQRTNRENDATQTGYHSSLSRSACFAKLPERKTIPSTLAI